MGLARTEKLAAVNTMLSVIGEAPVNTLDASSQTTDVAMAQSIIDEVSREVQSSGWHFNREYAVKLLPDASDNITIPTNAARVDVEPSDSRNKEYIQRGTKLYNKTDSTFIIEDAKKCTITYMLDWDDLPEHARVFIMTKTGRELQESMIGSKDLTEIDAGDFTIFDNYDVYRVIDRGNVRNQVSS